MQNSRSAPLKLRIAPMIMAVFLSAISLVSVITAHQFLIVQPSDNIAANGGIEVLQDVLDSRDGIVDNPLAIDSETGTSLSPENQDIMRGGNRGATITSQESDGAPGQDLFSTPGPSTVTEKKYCSGKYNIPEGVCKALTTAENNPTTTNPIFVGSARSAIALLPKGSKISYDERNWQSNSSSRGVMIIFLYHSSTGNRYPRLDMEKKGSDWVVTKITMQ